jgi:hypothetical protein
MTQICFDLSPQQQVTPALNWLVIKHLFVFATKLDKKPGHNLTNRISGLAKESFVDYKPHFYHSGCRRYPAYV